MPQMVSATVHDFNLNQGRSRFCHVDSAVIQSLLFMFIFKFLIYHFARNEPEGSILFTVPFVSIESFISLEGTPSDWRKQHV